MKTAREFFRNNKTEVYILLAILLLGAFLRLYQIDQFLTFLGDEGRDVLLVRRFLVNGDIFLIGPGTSIGNMYLGPLYYYMIAPSLWLAGYSPVGPAAFIALLGVLTIGLVWLVTYNFFGKFGGLVAAFLYAISPTIIIYSRSSWNPNIMPLFSLLCIWATWRAVIKSDFKWFTVLGVSMAFVLQSHYLGLLLIPTLGIFWIFGVFINRSSKTKLRNYAAFTILGAFLFLLLMSPLAIFDARHDWQNFDAIKKFFLERQTTVSAKPWNALPYLWPIYEEVSTRLIAGRNELFGAWASLFVLGGAIWVLAKVQLKRSGKLAFLLVGVWIGFSLLGLGLYKQHIYDHYYGVFFAAPFIILGGASAYLIEKNKIRGTWIVLTIPVFFTYFNLQENPLKSSPNNQLARTRKVAEKIILEANGEEFNLAVLAERNYEDAYQYFLEVDKAPVLEINPLALQDTLADTLFVVCELPEDKCDPVHSPKTEIANFGWSRIDTKWEVAGVIVYKLVHAN